jgi:heptosyltransferase-2
MAVSFHQPPQRLLVRGVNWLGDAVMTTPALIRLREKFRGSHIALLGPEKFRELWTLHPAVDEVISFEPGEGVWSVGGKLRAGRFDLALVLPNSPRSALEVWLAAIPQRVGYARPWRNGLLTQAVPARPGQVKMRKRTTQEIKRLVEGAGSSENPPPQVLNHTTTAHQLHEYLHLVAALGASAEPMPPFLVVTAAEEEAAARKFGLIDALTEARPVFGLNPGAEYGPAKRWPVDKFAAAAQEIQKQTRCVWMVLGGPADQPLAAQIQSALEPPPASLNLAGKTSLRELMALLKLCRVLLTNDTGPTHVAAALGTPVVVPFGSTSPELTGPGQPGDPRHRLLKSTAPCAPCFLRECPIDFRCLNGLGVEHVIEGVLQAAAG